MRCCGRFRAFQVYVVMLALVSAGVAAAQERPAIQRAEYGQWERLGFSTPLSPDGAWLAAPVTRVDGTLELRVHAVVGDGPVIVENGTAPVFSDDSTWLACAVGHSEAEADRLREAEEPVRQGLCLLRLGEAEAETIDQVEGFAFGGGSAYLAMKRYSASEDTPGSDLIVRNLRSGTEINFGNVIEYAWQDDGALLALAIGTADRAGNGVQLYAATTGSFRVLESGDADFRRLSWRQESADLAFLRSVQDDGYEEATHQVVAWRDLDAGGKAWRYDPADGADLPDGMHVSEHRRPFFSDDGATVFFGIREWHAKASRDEAPTQDGAGAEEAPETGSEEAEADVDPDAASDPEPDVLETDPSMVEVWHTRDEQIIPMQKVRKQRNEQATYLVAWPLEAGGLVRLGTDLFERLTLLEGQRYAVETDRAPHQFDNMFDRDWNDVWLIDVASGDRRKVIESVGYFYGGSPQGRYLLVFQGRPLRRLRHRVGRAPGADRGASRVLRRRRLRHSGLAPAAPVGIRRLARR